MGKKSLEGAQSIKKIFPDKRDRSLCKHNMNGYCVEFQCKCENRNCASFEDFTKPKTFVKCKPKLKPFDGIKYVDITLIKLKNPDKNPPLEFQIKQTKELFEKEKGVNIPITVSCKEDYYLLQDDYVIYYVAKLMDYKTVPIKIGTQGQNKFRRKLQVGVKVSHDKYGIGEIIKCDDKYIIISFDGEEKQFQLDFCVKNRVLKII